MKLGPVLVGITLVALLAGACGGGESPPAASDASPTAEEDDFVAPPLEVPEGCPKASSELEVWALAASWADAKGNQYGVLEACLTAVADEPISVTLHNVKAKGVLNLKHNFSIYSDSLALDRLFYLEPIASGKDKTFNVPALGDGTYLYRCDLHARVMKGILVVE